MNTKAEVEQKIKDILVEDFDVDLSVLKSETDLFADLDLDSIDAVDLVVRLQRETGKKVEPAQFKQIRTLSDVTEAVYKLIHA